MLFTKRYYSDQIKENGKGGHVACMGEMRNSYKISFRKSKGKRVLSRHGHRWEDNITINLRDI